MTTIDLNAVDFEMLLKSIRATNRTAIDGVRWAKLYVSTDGRAVAIYASGDRIITRNAAGVDYVIEFYDDDDCNRYYNVNLAKLTQRGGIEQEAKNARYYIARALTKECETRYLPKQRAVVFAKPVTNFNY